MRFVTAAALLLFAGTARSEQWLQRYHDAQHTSFIGTNVSTLTTETFRYIFDPSEVDVGTGDILVHYTDPKIEANGDMFVTLRDRQGTVVTYSVQKLSGGAPVWTFQSDYVRQPSGAWEPMFDFAVDVNAGDAGIVYVMARYGCVSRLNEPDGSLIDLKCATDPIDPTGQSIWDVSPFTIDGNGNVYWTIRSSSSLIGSSIVKLDSAGNVTASGLANLAGVGQIAANNSGPAVSADNAVIYVATTLSNQSQGKLLALDATDPSLQTLLWTGSLAQGGSCHEARLNDSGTSSPVALPDGGAAIGGWNSFSATCTPASECPTSEGFYYSFDSTGGFRGCYPFGWDDTMGQITLNGTTYLVGKHNHYTSGSRQCNNGIDPPVNPPCYEIVVLDSTTMEKQWSYIAPNRDPVHGVYEWCIDAPTLHKTTNPDGSENGIVTAPSESGDLFQVLLFSDPPVETDVHVGGPQNAAYVPTVSIGGAAYTINHGQVVGVGSSDN
jgi:hypothetical protein